MNFLERLREANIARDIEWNNGAVRVSMLFRANELAGEVGEACNVLKKLDREHNYKIKGSRDTFYHLSEELADIVICGDLVAMDQKISFPVTCWGKVEEVGQHDYSLYGATLASIVGRICGTSIHYKSHFNNLQLSSSLCGLVSFTKTIADRIGFDMESAVSLKFNATSHKLELKTFL
jgi:NTP pyrophosphatase (non-canonical NTP hydrolase)